MVCGVTQRGTRDSQDSGAGGGAESELDVEVRQRGSKVRAQSYGHQESR